MRLISWSLSSQTIVTGHIVPLNAISKLVVHNCQTGLVMKLLETLNGDPDIVVSLDWSLLDTLVIVWLWFACLSCGAPVSIWVGCVGWRDSVIIGPRPEPSVYIDRLQVGSVTTLVLEITFSPA